MVTVPVLEGSFLIALSSFLMVSWSMRVPAAPESIMAERIETGPGSCDLYGLRMLCHHYETGCHLVSLL